jgi:hypothetical protein
MESTQQIQTVEERFTSLRDLVARVDSKIESQLDYEIALDGISQAKEISKTWVNLFDGIRAAQKEALDTTYAQINKIKLPCEDMVRNLSSKCSEWDRRQKAYARELEMKANEAAKNAAEDAILREAAHAAAIGDTAKAEAILSTPMPVVPMVHMAPSNTSTANLSKKTKWRAEVHDLAALIKAVASQTPGVPTNALEPNLSVLNKLAATLGEELRIPGVTVVEDFTYARKVR